MTGDYELEMNDIVTEKSTSDEQGSKGGKSKKKDRMDVWATMTLKDMAGNEQSLALVIENKIYSGEGAEQTERYHQYVISNVLGKDTKPVEIFLTPPGIAENWKDRGARAISIRMRKTCWWCEVKGLCV